MGLRHMSDAYDRYGDVLVDSMCQLQDYAERKFKAGTEKLPDGVYQFTDYMDGAGTACPDPLKICVTITVANSSMTPNFNGTVKQVPDPINVTYNGLLAMVLYLLKALIDPTVPLNAGIYRVFSVECESGLLVNAENSAPVDERIDTCQRMADVILGALASAVLDCATACCNSSVILAVSSGVDQKDKDCFFVYLEIVAGGLGASRGADGFSDVQVYMTNISDLPVEALEIEFPLATVNKYKLRRDDGGAGRNRGGLDIVRELEMMYDGISYTGFGDRQKIPPWGLEDGPAGEGGVYYPVKPDGTSTRLPPKCTDTLLEQGDVINMQIPGSGGYGNPPERVPLRVLIDVIEGKVSPEKVQKLYSACVVKNDSGWAVDGEKTKRFREKR